MEYIEKIKPIVQKAGDLVMSHFRSDMTIHRKKDHSFATDADLACEKLLKHELEAIIPGSGFIAEESGSQDGNDFIWVIDPVDGTKNFSRGIPYFCISVALMEGQEIIAAVIYYPAMNEWFYAQKGFGCWLNGKQVRLDQPKWKEKGALVVVSDFRIRQSEFLATIKKQSKLAGTYVRFRLYGAAALDLAYAAIGAFDAVLFENLGWWDAAAGVLLVQEAGGFVGQYDGTMINRELKSLIAGHDEICKMIISGL